MTSSSPTHPPHVPRAAYAGTMLAATLAAGVAAWLVVDAAGGNLDTTRAVLIALGAGSFMTFVPAVLSIGKDFWGFSVLLSGVARSLLMLAVCYFLQPAAGGDASRPLVMAALTAMLLLLAVETAATVVILTNIDKRSAAARIAPMVSTPSATLVTTNRNPA